MKKCFYRFCILAKHDDTHLSVCRVGRKLGHTDTRYKPSRIGMLFLVCQGCQAENHLTNFFRGMQNGE